jgi:hypothetical protein
MEKIYAEHRPGGRVFQVPSNGPPFRASAGTCLSTWPAICLAFSAASSSYEARTAAANPPAASIAYERRQIPPYACRRSRPAGGYGINRRRGQAPLARNGARLSGDARLHRDGVATTDSLYRRKTTPS